MKKMLNEGNQMHRVIFISSSGSGTVINYGSGSDFLTSYGSTSKKVTVPVPQRCLMDHRHVAAQLVRPRRCVVAGGAAVAHPLVHRAHVGLHLVLVAGLAIKNPPEKTPKNPPKKFTKNRVFWGFFKF
jgi:hypothetical protein